MRLRQSLARLGQHRIRWIDTATYSRLATVSAIALTFLSWRCAVRYHECPCHTTYSSHLEVIWPMYIRLQSSSPEVRFAPRSRKLIEIRQSLKCVASILRLQTISQYPTSAVAWRFRRSENRVQHGQRKPGLSIRKTNFYTPGAST